VFLGFERWGIEVLADHVHVNLLQAGHSVESDEEVKRSAR
jgi:hypothetical protein